MFEEIEVAKTIYKESRDGYVEISNISEYMQIEGIWVLYGKSKETAEKKCLNVGTSKNVGQEILYDLGCIHFFKGKEVGSRQYINQRNEDCGFKYVVGQSREYLYSFIATQYDSFEFVYVNNKSDKQKEKKIAEKNKHIFWRNGRPFSKNQFVYSEEDIQHIKKLLDDGDGVYYITDLIRLLKDEIGYDERKIKKLLKECERKKLLYRADNFIFR